MTYRLAGAVLIAVLLALPVASAWACAEMLASEESCPMEQESTQPAPAPAKMSCCYLSVVEPATGTAPVKLQKMGAEVATPVATVPAPVFVPQHDSALHGLSPGQSPSRQPLFCVFLI